jgi:hypothetical protein
VNDIAHGLQCLATDDALHADLRAAGLARAARSRWQRAAAETVRVYDAVA